MNIMEMFPEVKFYVSKVSFLLISSQYLMYSVNQGYYLLGVSLPGTIHKRLKGIDRQCMVVQLRIQNKNKKKYQISPEIYVLSSPNLHCWSHY